MVSLVGLVRLGYLGKVGLWNTSFLMVGTALRVVVDNPQNSWLPTWG